MIAPPIVILAFCIAGCALGTPVSDRPTSLLDLRFEATVPQNLDFSCGAASLATLLRYYWSEAVSEETALLTLQRRYSKEEMKAVTQRGLSFDDLIYIANQLGFDAEGAKIAVQELRKLSGPVIVHLDKGILQHFVVLRRAGDGVFYLSDPVAGSVAMHSDEFEREYTGHALAVWRPAARLPNHSPLERPRDGINVEGVLWHEINVRQWPSTLGF